jgi:putative ABC transport system substrate-binding protein
VQFGQLKRRDFITLIGGAAAWPLGARAQSTMPVIGFLGTGSEAQSHGQVTGFRRGLSQVGFDEGRNVAFE